MRSRKKAASIQTEAFRPLLVAIMRGEQALRIAELADPREGFCRHYNSMGGGTEAVPVPTETRQLKAV